MKTIVRKPLMLKIICISNDNEGVQWYVNDTLCKHQYNPWLYVRKEYSKYIVLRRCNNYFYWLYRIFMCVSVYGDDFN